ncbi:hypothetical protein EP51_39325 (plasmid) [Rhodococcus opacus]|uniref:Uncharacterized protein n=1 Tax=Rhodococcus opacus TaxID=37919 RepID=A0A076EYB8_RHOOP|nr:hypothetical protein EP51_39325 [Rhodococcus opacus]
MARCTELGQHGLAGKPELISVRQRLTAYKFEQRPSAHCRSRQNMPPERRRDLIPLLPPWIGTKLVQRKNTQKITKLVYAEFRCRLKLVEVSNFTASEATNECRSLGPLRRLQNRCDFRQ